MGQPANNANKKVIYKNCVSFSNCFIRINNMQDIDVQDIDVAMPMCNIIEYSDIIKKHLEFYGNIAQANQLQMRMVGDIVDFNAANATTDLFEIKEKNNSSKCRKAWLKSFYFLK